MINAALRILSGSTVATSTAERLIREGVDAARLAALLTGPGKRVTVGEYIFKLIEADPETPTNFGVLVRRLDGSARAPN